MRLNAKVKLVDRAPPSDDDTPQASVQAAPLLLIGAVQVIETEIRGTSRIVITQTMVIVEAGPGDATGQTAEATTDATQIAIEALPSLDQ